jgi:hypothetical protein
LKRRPAHLRQPGGSQPRRSRRRAGRCSRVGEAADQSLRGMSAGPPGDVDVDAETAGSVNCHSPTAIDPSKPRWRRCVPLASSLENLITALWV